MLSFPHVHFQKSGNIVNFCSETLKLNGSIPITSYSAITDENATLSAITAVAVDQHTVAFVGTSDGYLKKVYTTSIRKNMSAKTLQMT